MRRAPRLSLGAVLSLAAAAFWYLWSSNLSAAIARHNPASETKATIYYIVTILAFTGAITCFLWKSGARTWYAVGLPLYIGSLYIGSKLNPRDMVGGSWTDPYFQVSSWVGFFCCVIAPFRLNRPLALCSTLFALTLAGLLAAWWIWYVSTA